MSDPKSNWQCVAWSVVVVALVAGLVWWGLSMTPEEARRTREQLRNAYKGQYLRFHKYAPFKVE